MTNLILIFTGLLIGMLSKKLKLFPERAHTTLNAFCLSVSLPAVVLIQITNLLRTTQLSVSLLIPVSMAWILFGASYLGFKWIGKKLHWTQKEIAALTLTAGLGNTSFVGFPLLEYLMGHSSIAIGVVVDQLGSFLVLSTAGLIYASTFSPLQKKKPTPGVVAKKVLKFPPFLALIASVAWFWTGTSAEPTSQAVIERLASTLVPISLVAVGLQLQVSPSILKKYAKKLAAGLGFKLILAPLFFTLLYAVVFRSKLESTQITLLEAAMAPMITSAVIAEEFGFDAELASLMVGVGIPLSLISVPVWHRVFHLIGV